MKKYYVIAIIFSFFVFLFFAYKVQNTPKSNQESRSILVEYDEKQEGGDTVKLYDDADLVQKHHAIQLLTYGDLDKSDPLLWNLYFCRFDKPNGETEFSFCSLLGHGPDIDIAPNAITQSIELFAKDQVSTSLSQVNLEKITQKDQDGGTIWSLLATKKMSLENALRLVDSQKIDFTYEFDSDLKPTTIEVSAKQLLRIKNFLAQDVNKFENVQKRVLPIADLKDFFVPSQTNADQGEQKPSSIVYKVPSEYQLDVAVKNREWGSEANYRLDLGRVAVLENNGECVGVGCSVIRSHIAGDDVPFGAGFIFTLINSGRPYINAVKKGHMEYYVGKTLKTLDIAMSEVDKLKVPNTQSLVTRETLCTYITSVHIVAKLADQQQLNFRLCGSNNKLDITFDKKLLSEIHKFLTQKMPDIKTTTQN